MTELQPTLDYMADYFQLPFIPEEDIMSFQLASAFGVQQEKEMFFWKTQEHILCKTALLAQERVQMILDTYTDDDTQIYVVTHRSPSYHSETEQWLVEKDIPYHKLFCTNHSSKMAIIKEEGIEAAFEDNPSFFEEIEQQNLSGLVDTYCIDYSYNKHVTCTYRLDRKSGMEIAV